MPALFDKKVLFMKAKVNNQAIKIFKRAQIKDLLRRYSYQKYKEVKRGSAIIKDSNNNRVYMDGEVSNNQRYYIVNI